MKYKKGDKYQLLVDIKEFSAGTHCMIKSTTGSDPVTLALNIESRTVWAKPGQIKKIEFTKKENK